MIDRRSLLLSGATAGGLASAATTAAASDPAAPTLDFLFEMHVQVGEALTLGASPLGERNVVLFKGGTFEGPQMRGVILPGGVSRHLDHADGKNVAEVIYDLRIDDGVTISVREHAIIDRPPGSLPHGFSAVELTAPEGPYAWLNRRVVVAKLTVTPGTPPVVRTRFYALG